MPWVVTVHGAGSMGTQVCRGGWRLKVGEDRLGGAVTGPEHSLAKPHTSRAEHRPPADRASVRPSCPQKRPQGPKVLTRSWGLLLQPLCWHPTTAGDMTLLPFSSNVLRPMGHPWGSLNPGGPFLCSRGPWLLFCSPPGLTSVAEPATPAILALAIEVAHEVLADVRPLLIAGVRRALVGQL